MAAAVNVQYTVNPVDACATVAYVVAWNDKNADGDGWYHATTSWNGIVRGDVMETTWVRADSCKPGDEERNVTIGHDTYTRVKRT